MSMFHQFRETDLIKKQLYLCIHNQRSVTDVMPCSGTLEAVSLLLPLPPCSSDPSKTSRRSESLAEDHAQPCNNWITVMWIKMFSGIKPAPDVFSNRRQLLGAPLPGRPQPIRWQLKLAGFHQKLKVFDVSSSGSVLKLLRPITTVDFGTPV